MNTVKKLNQGGFSIALLAVIVAVLAIIGFVFARMTVLKKTTPPSQTEEFLKKTNSNTDYQALSNDEVEITGTVTGKFDDRPMDGDAGVIIDGKYRVTTDVGGDLSTEQRAKLIFGKTDTVNIGDKVEVYGKKTSQADKFTLIGDSTYYLKKL